MEKMPGKEELILVHKYLSGQMEEPEKQQFERRLAQEPELVLLKEDTAMVWAASAHYREPKFDSNRGYQEFQRNLRRKGAGRRIWITSAAAAALLILVAGGIFLNHNPKVNLNELIASKTIEETLEDGSTIQMHAGAHIRIPDAFGKRKRRVEIVSGEIYFDITPDANRPFIVVHPWAEVKVVGTEFMISVDTLTNDYTILVTEGKISFVPNLSNDEIAVSVGTGLKFNADTRMIEPIRQIDENALSWQTGVLTFIDRPVSYVIADLEAHYELEIELVDSQAEDCLFTAPLPYKNVPVTVILDAITTTFGMTLKTVSPKHYILSRGKCRKQMSKGQNE